MDDVARMPSDGDDLYGEADASQEQPTPRAMTKRRLREKTPSNASDRLPAVGGRGVPSRPSRLEDALQVRDVAAVLHLSPPPDD